MKDTITEMASMIESLQMSMSLLQKSHKNLQDNVIVSTHICLVCVVAENMVTHRHTDIYIQTE